MGSRNWIYFSRVQSIISFAKKNNLFIIEDCAHAHGAKIDNKMAGNIGDVGCFSFYPSKIITTGTGGMLTTNDVKLANYTKQMRFFGRNIRRRGVLLEGNDWFMDEIRACVGFHQMNDLKKILNRRRKIAKIYNFFFKKSRHIKQIYLPKNVEGTFYQYPIFIYNKQLRQKVIDQLKSKYKISTKKIWLPTHQEKIFEDLKFSKKTLLNTEKTFNNSICLPIYPEMTDQKTKDIAKKVLSIVENCV